MNSFNDDQSSLKKELDAENQKWLQQLLNPTEESEEPKAEDTPPKAEPEAEEAVQQAEPFNSKDVEIEKILSEDWFGEATPVAPAESVCQEASDGTELPGLSESELAAIFEDVEEDTKVLSDEAEATITEPEEAPEESVKADIEPQPRKIRPKRKGGYGLLGIPHILVTVVWLALILAIGVSLGRVLWVCCADVMAFGKESQSVTITITEDDDIDSISQKLGHANLVRYPGLFKLFATLTGKDSDIGVGTFTLNSQLDYNALVNAMYDYGPNREVVEIMFPEGVNCAQIFKLLEEKNVCSVADLEEYAANGELSSYWFLEGVARGSKYCLEGYLAPDTYKFYTGDSPRRVLEKFLDEFDDRFTDIMKKDFETMQKAFHDRLKAKGFNADYIAQNSLTLHKVVTLASVIQKETSSDAECYDIASTFYNRLVNPNIMTLGADATVYYALGDYFWEIEALTAAHLEVDSPYNTRKYKGIPPGPICNMGVQALYATLEPNETGYHYFVYDTEKGAHRFAATYNEHLNNLKELGY